MDNGCTCQRCRKVFQVDLIIPDDLWEKIKPDSACAGGLLCGACIMESIERISSFDAWKLVKA